MRSSTHLHGLVTLALLVAPLAARGDDFYPTLPDDQDYLCETIARSPSGMVPAGDRAWFKQTCACSESGVCGRPGSKRYAARLKAAPSDVQAQKEAAARERAWRRSALQSTERLRQEYRACRAVTRECEQQMVVLDEACKVVGLLTWDECLAKE